MLLEKNDFTLYKNVIFIPWKCYHIFQSNRQKHRLIHKLNVKNPYAIGRTSHNKMYIKIAAIFIPSFAQ